MGQEFRDRVALVTGGAGGIGRAAAEIFAREGARVAVVDVNIEGGEETAERVRKSGGEVLFHRADVADEDAVRRMVAAVVSAFGRLDCAFNNAGMSGQNSSFHELSLEEWSRVLTLNLTGVFLCMKHEIPRMLEQGGGAIVNTSSGAGVVGFPSLPHYVASKHGVLGLTKCAAMEYVRRGIRVNAILPGTTDTPMIRAYIGGNADVERMLRSTSPTGEMGRPEQVAEAAVWLCSERASFVNGESMLVDGGAVCR